MHRKEEKSRVERAEPFSSTPVTNLLLSYPTW